MSDAPFDPFARPAFYADPETERAVLPHAEAAVDVARREFGTQLDWSAASVASVERILGRLHDRHTAGDLSPAATTEYSRQFGSYLGEVIRRTHGGSWGVGRIFSDTAPAVRVGTPPAAVDVWPWASAANRITRGPGEDVLEFYQSLVRNLAEAGKPSTAAASVVRPRDCYPLRHDNGSFDAGTASGGRQVLMGFFWDGPTAIFFDADGGLLGHEVRPLPAEPTTHPTSGMPLHTPEFDAAVERATEAWKAEMGFRPEPIRVRQFKIVELGVGVEDRPWHYEEFLNAPESTEPDEDERRRTWEAIREWEADGSFVLYWGNDLWIDGTGEVTSS